MRPLQVFANSPVKASSVIGRDMVNPKGNSRRDIKKVEIDAWIPEVIAASLIRDIENFFKTKITAMSGNLDQVNREGFDLRARVLQRTREKLDALEVRLAQGTKFGAESNAGT
jgi:BMFP domain-containing protein YqiC